jgi:hypothetical protein
MQQIERDIDARDDDAIEDEVIRPGPKVLLQVECCFLGPTGPDAWRSPG